MEFTGRISKVLPVRSGTSQRGNEWQALPFVFEYFEHENDRYADSVLGDLRHEHHRWYSQLLRARCYWSIGSGKRRAEDDARDTGCLRIRS